MNERPHRAHCLKLTWIVIATMAATANTMFSTMALTLLRLNNRTRGEKMIKKWTTRVLKLAQVRHTRVLHAPLKLTPNRCHIVMCTHASAYDIPLAFAAFEGFHLRMLGKKELTKIPLFGPTLRFNEFVFIDRKNRSNAIKDLETAKKIMQSGILMWVAPEGTRSQDGKLGPFKKGVFHLAVQTDAIIIPVAIRKAHDLLPTKSFKLRLNQPVETHIGAPIDTRDFPATDKKYQVLVNHVRDVIQGLLGTS